jgi:hypothetical protein
MNHDTHHMTFTRFHGHRTYTERARTRPYPSHPRTQERRLIPADQHRTHCGATRAGGEHALPHPGTQDAQAVLDDVWAVRPPLPAKAGFGCSCFDDGVAHALASDKRGGLPAYVGYLWSHRALSACAAVLGRLRRQDAVDTGGYDGRHTPIMIVG